MKSNYRDVFVAISSNKIQLLVDFYCQLFKKQPTVHQPSIYAEFQLENFRLAIFKPKAEHESEFENLNSAMSLCLEVEDLEQAITQISEMGYPPKGKIIEASHGRELYADDPTGNRLIFYQPNSR